MISLTKPHGIVNYGQPLNNFEIAGTDGIYHPAKAKILRNGTLEVFCS